MLRRKPSNVSEKEQVPQKKKLTLQRSSSFKDFMKHRPTSPVVSEKEFTLEENVTEAVPPEEAGKSGSKLGNKWRKVISRTMTRKTSKMVQKALAEEGGEIGEETSPISDWLPNLSAGQRTSVCSSGSEDTLPSPISRQLSGSSDRQSLDSGYCQRDSMRLEESGLSYTGPFCGRAVVHTDFTPSPYDMESLKLQKGDIMYIIEKPPVGTWTGKLNNKVGSFKFIYVNLLPDESPPVRRRRCGSKGQRVKSKPKTLEEVLDSIGLTELSSLLSMHGFQSLEDFAGLKESHLNELNLTDPEQRSKILSASELLRDSEDESEPEEEENRSAEEEENRSAEEAKEPRDSGCFESSENLESGRGEVKKEEELQSEASEEQTDEGAEKHEQEEEEEEKQTERLEEVQEQLEEVQEQLEEVQEQLEEVQEHPEEVQEQLEGVPEHPEEGQEQLEEVQEQLEEVQEQLEEVQEQLEELTLDEGR
ncbi:SAM and SH3 domain-containing protein 3 isoform X1 [Hippoglossus hippoglossus]|uniref:SAM and SH3 domain-containing protein 3 isoform X1 n=1 Tax=Hippoglossus hippoglossus TaxID=8267 RepID=UPI00148E511E|nr:SAM and SH3 domain-containing protein 3 isoform X1 [Hippoglossus hippoglossus]